MGIIIFLCPVSLHNKYNIYYIMKEKLFADLDPWVRDLDCDIKFVNNNRLLNCAQSSDSLVGMAGTELFWFQILIFSVTHSHPLCQRQLQMVALRLLPPEIQIRQAISWWQLGRAAEKMQNCASFQSGPAGQNFGQYNSANTLSLLLNWVNRTYYLQTEE